jgi:hypothetical protein
MDTKQIQKQLHDMLDTDLQKRKQLLESGSLFDGYHPEMEQVHVTNSKRLEQLINEFGYPTKRKVGVEAASAAWTIVMHSISNPPFMKKILDLLKSPHYIDEIEPRELAYLEDRICTLGRKPQIYGTQFDWDENNLLSPSPIENLQKVNELRIALGMSPIEKQTEIMRERARQEGHKPPGDYHARLTEMEDWARKVGWITKVQ